MIKRIQDNHTTEIITLSNEDQVSKLTPLPTNLPASLTLDPCSHRSRYPHRDLPLDADPRREEADQRRAARQSYRHQEHGFQSIHVTKRDLGQDFRREQTSKTGSSSYHRRRIDAGHFGSQAGDQDVAEDGLAGGDEDCGAEELEDCAVC